MSEPVTLQINFADNHPETYVAVQIHPDYIDEPVIVGMTIVKGLKRLRETIRQQEDDGA